MKIAIVMTLFLLSFSTASLAIAPIERAALDLVMARGDDGGDNVGDDGGDDKPSCKWMFQSCETQDECCEDWVCYKGSCQYLLVIG
nr:Tx-1132 [Heteropoda pingtungensis]